MKFLHEAGRALILEKQTTTKSSSENVSSLVKESMQDRCKQDLPGRLSDQNTLANRNNKTFTASQGK
jgi:hypothetical protein